MRHFKLESSENHSLNEFFEKDAVDEVNYGELVKSFLSSVIHYIETDKSGSYNVSDFLHANNIDVNDQRWKQNGREEFLRTLCGVFSGFHSGNDINALKESVKEALLTKNQQEYLNKLDQNFKDDFHSQSFEKYFEAMKRLLPKIYGSIYQHDYKNIELVENDSIKGTITAVIFDFYKKHLNIKKNDIFSKIVKSHSWADEDFITPLIKSLDKPEEAKLFFDRISRLVSQWKQKDINNLTEKFYKDVIQLHIDILMTSPDHMRPLLILQHVLQNMKLLFNSEGMPEQFIQYPEAMINEFKKTLEGQELLLDDKTQAALKGGFFENLNKSYVVISKFIGSLLELTEERINAVSSARNPEDNLAAVFCSSFSNSEPVKSLKAGTMEDLTRNANMSYNMPASVPKNPSPPSSGSTHSVLKTPFIKTLVQRYRDLHWFFKVATAFFAVSGALIALGGLSGLALLYFYPMIPLIAGFAVMTGSLMMMGLIVFASLAVACAGLTITLAALSSHLVHIVGGHKGLLAFWGISIGLAITAVGLGAVATAAVLTFALPILPMMTALYVTLGGLAIMSSGLAVVLAVQLACLVHQIKKIMKQRQSKLASTDSDAESDAGSNHSAPKGLLHRVFSCLPGKTTRNASSSGVPYHRVGSAA